MSRYTLGSVTGWKTVRFLSVTSRREGMMQILCIGSLRPESVSTPAVVGRFFFCDMLIRAWCGQFSVLASRARLSTSCLHLRHDFVANPLRQITMRLFLKKTAIISTHGCVVHGDALVGDVSCRIVLSRIPVCSSRPTSSKKGQFSVLASRAARLLQVVVQGSFANELSSSAL